MREDASMAREPNQPMIVGRKRKTPAALKEKRETAPVKFQ
jgi:hypothetical protein